MQLTKPTVNDYSIPEPTFPLGGYVLGAVVVLGLVALFMAAQHAFLQVATSEVQAFFNAVLIETSAIVEALTLARARKKEDYVLAGVATTFSLVVSGTYNYVQVESTGRTKNITDPWQLWTLALGPLAALGFLSLNLGRALREHEDAKAAWLMDRQKWLDGELMAYDDRLVNAQRERDQRDAEERERARLAAERERDRQARRDARLERERIKAAAAGTTTTAPPANGSTDGTSTDTTGTSIPAIGSEAEFFAYMRQQNGTAPKSGAEVKARLKLPHTTAYRYWNAWRVQNNAEPIVEN